MPIPERFIDELKSRLKMCQTWWANACALSEKVESFKLAVQISERTPSFTVNDAKGFYHCFGCGQHGNIINFMMEYEG